jgi:hypothetical protein
VCCEEPVVSPRVFEVKSTNGNSSKSESSLFELERVYAYGVFSLIAVREWVSLVSGLACTRSARLRENYGGRTFRFAGGLGAEAALETAVFISACTCACVSALLYTRTSSIVPLKKFVPPVEPK